MRLLSIVLCGFILVVSGGCATVMRGNRQEMKFQTEPAGATVTVDGTKYTSPATVVLKRKEAHEVVVSSPGYRTIQFRLESQWDGASLPNIILPAGSLGFATDTAGGADRAFYELAMIRLQKTDDPAAAPLVLRERRGKLMTQAEYDAEVAAEREDRSRFFGSEQ